MIAQIGIALLGVTAIWLSQSRQEHLRRYACLFGLAGQPFWFWAAFDAQQWGIFAICFLYTLSWARGFKQHWIDAARKEQA
ncbi:hypothetical protein [Alcaligenes aquatilis]|uniref:hypothetical protein n=1 Tax=Alcaligenes aquatilis TaxID=323284 RepID=UPI0036208E21